MLLELNSKGLYQSLGKEKGRCCFANIDLFLFLSPSSLLTEAKEYPLCAFLLNLFI